MLGLWSHLGENVVVPVAGLPCAVSIFGCDFRGVDDGTGAAHRVESPFVVEVDCSLNVCEGRHSRRGLEHEGSVIVYGNLLAGTLLGGHEDYTVTSADSVDGCGRILED